MAEKSGRTGLPGDRQCTLGFALVGEARYSRASFTLATFMGSTLMPKAYWISAYHAVHDENKLAAYAKLALPAVTAAGGKFLARGVAAKAYEAGMVQRTVVIEFESLEIAIACHDSPGYQAAMVALGDGVTRDLRIVEGA